MEKSNAQSTILIVGGCGYIGTALVNHLSSKGLGVDSLDLELYGKHIEQNFLKDAFDFTEFHKYEQIVLLAGHSSVLMSEKNSHETFKNNVILFEHILDQIDSQKLIYASSAAVYNGNDIEHEDLPFCFQACNMYDVSKYTIDQLAKISKKSYYGLRFGTVCGYSPCFRNDTIINRMTQTAIEKGKVDVFNGKNRRGILGINDLCRAIELILTAKQDIPGFYNLCSFNDSVINIAKDVGKALSVPVNESSEPTTTYDFTINCGKFIDAFNWNPVETTTSIVEDLKSNWHQPLSKRYFYA